MNNQVVTPPSRQRSERGDFDWTPIKKRANEAGEKRKRAYNGPPKGSAEAKARMEKVRAAQWAKNGLVQGGSSN